MESSQNFIQFESNPEISSVVKENNKNTEETFIQKESKDDLVEDKQLDKLDDVLTQKTKELLNENVENVVEATIEKTDESKEKAENEIEEKNKETEEITETLETSDNKTEESKIGIWEDILGSGSVMKKLLVKGKPDSRPPKSSLCTINYKLMLEDESLIEEKTNAVVQLGDLEVMQGVEVVLATMDEGEKCQLLIEPRLAFGTYGLKPAVGPDTKVLYELELVSSEVEDDLDFLTLAERKRRGNIKRERGNWWYSRDECPFAIQCYRRALDYLDEVEGGITNPLPENYDPKDHEMSDEALQDLLEDRLNVYNNMAAAQLKMEAYDAAMQSVQNVLRCQPQNVKALYRKSKILRIKCELNEALKCLNKAKSLDPDNKIIIKEIQEITLLMQKQKNYEKELAKRMFNSGSPKSDKKPKDNKNNSGFKPIMLAALVGAVAVGIAGLAAWRFKI